MSYYQSYYHRVVIQLVDFIVFCSKVHFNIFLCLHFCGLFYLSKRILVRSQTTYCSCQGGSQGGKRNIILS